MGTESPAQLYIQEFQAGSLIKSPLSLEHSIAFYIQVAPHNYVTAVYFLAKDETLVATTAKHRLRKIKLNIESRKSQVSRPPMSSSD